MIRQALFDFACAIGLMVMLYAALHFVPALDAAMIEAMK